MATADGLGSRLRVHFCHARLWPWRFCDDHDTGGAITGNGHGDRRFYGPHGDLQSDSSIDQISTHSDARVRRRHHLFYRGNSPMQPNAGPLLLFCILLIVPASSKTATPVSSQRAELPGITLPIQFTMAGPNEMAIAQQQGGYY